MFAVLISNQGQEVDVFPWTLFKCNTTRTCYTGKKQVCQLLPASCDKNRRQKTCRARSHLFTTFNCRKSTGSRVGKLQPQKIDSTALWQCQQKLNIIFIKVVFIAGLLCWIALDYTVLPVTVSTFCSVWPLAGIMCLRTVRVVLRLANCKKKLLSEKISCISFQALTLEKQKVQRCTFSLTE